MSKTLTFWVFTLFALCQSWNSSAQIDFIPNGGQWPANVQFRAEVASGALFVEDQALTWHFLQWPYEHTAALHAGVGQGEESLAGRPTHSSMYSIDDDPEDHMVKAHAYRLSLLGAEGPLRFRPSEERPGKVNFILGQDRNQWAGNLSRYGRVQASYAPGMTLVLYSQGNNIKYDMVVEPGADPSRFAMLYEGQEKMSIIDGDLHIQTSLGAVVEMKPYAYQEIAGQRITVPCRYKLRGDRLEFEFPKSYDLRHTLVIDPVTWVFGSYSGSTSDNWGYSATYDAEGNLYGAGIVFGAGYPITLGAYQTVFGGGPGSFGCDVAITKFSADGSTNIWSTYLGGNGNEFPHSMIVNEAGELWVYGTTGSTNYPLSPGAFDNLFAAGTNVTVTGVFFPVGTDIYLSRLSADGDELLASTYVGGVSNDGLNLGGATSFNYGDHARGEIILDVLGNPVVASSTNSIDFPVTAGVFQPSSGGGQDGVIFSLSADLSTMLWSTYFGGSGSDGVYSIKFEESGSLIAGGGTNSPDLATTPGVILPGFSGSADGYVLRLNSGATAIENCSYIGTPSYDQVYFVALDTDGDVYLTGQTRSGVFPVTPGIYSVPSSGQFILKLLPDFSNFEYSMLYGSGSGEINISPTAFLVDICENVYISGWGGITNTFGSTSGMPVTPDALKSTTDGSDFYFSVFSADMTGLEFASFYGGNISREHVDGGTSRFDQNGVIYQAVCAGCGSNDDFPTTVGSVSQTNNSSNCNLGVAKIALDFSGVNAGLDVEPELIGCLPLAADFINNSTGAVAWLWDFGDGSPLSTDFEPSHTYTTAGEFTVTLIATDPSSCNLADTALLTVIVHQDSTLADFELTVTDYCDSLLVDLDNNSFSVGPAVYFWDFGDGSSSLEESPRHVYYLPGTYILQLIVFDPLSCNGGDTLSATVTVAPRAVAAVSGGAGCAPLLLEPFNGSVGISPAYTWEFGDGALGEGPEVSHLYEEPGVYTLTLIMDDPASCNNGDTATATVEVYPNPELSISVDPLEGSFYQLVQFNASSPEADEIRWDLGNGITAFGESYSFQYEEPGEYLVCAYASSIENCRDSTCVLIRLDADSELAFPNAFSPNGDGTNDVLLPFNWGLQSYLLRIYNRWGELIFESNDPLMGWDGTYKGEPQEVGMYKITASGLGLDGRTYTTVSDLFLLR